MTTSVDVLAVMARDATAAWNDRRGDREIQDFLGKESNEARAAVAELIEVARQFDSYASADFGDTSILDNEELWDRLSAALARVKGA